MGRPQILFVHDAYPGQFGGFASWLARMGWDVWAVTRKRPGLHKPVTNDGVRVLPCDPHRPPSGATHPYAQPFDRAALLGQAAVRTCLAARTEGLCPDLIISHAGPGAGLFLQDVFSRAVQIAYCEWWYNSPGVDTAHLDARPGRTPSASPEAAIIERSRNLPIATELLSAGQGLCPTAFQPAQFPDTLRGLLRVQHDGIDCARFRPGPPGNPVHPLLARLDTDVPLVSYATRGMEPHRGFPEVMTALANLQARHPKLVAVIAGKNAVHYGGDRERRTDWKAEALRRLHLDPARTLFTGTLGPDDYRWLLRRSNAHVYATVPFVLSWSMLDAMACQTPLVLSDTAPVREFADADTALLFDPARPDRLADAIAEVLADPASAHRRARAARARVLDTLASDRIYTEKAAWLLELLPVSPSRSTGIERPVLAR
jgi:glycosyltransferase involved in cell wall biosynthesis